MNSMLLSRSIIDWVHANIVTQFRVIYAMRRHSCENEKSVLLQFNLNRIERELVENCESGAKF